MQNWTQLFPFEMGPSLHVALWPGTEHLGPLGEANAGGEGERTPEEWQKLKARDEIRFGQAGNNE